MELKPCGSGFFISGLYSYDLGNSLKCNTPVQVKGGSLAQLSGVAPLSTGYYLAQKCSKEAASLPLPLRGKSLKNGGTKFETDKTQRSCRKEWRLQSQAQ
ncbi:hypothetical protein [Dysosmobacter sp. Sow4_B12]|uniref:hypothetical protein n=1 Tax=Dysosmobacter sp. Sow4_B12 TaxID=3438777 RepID=UPI003F935533